MLNSNEQFEMDDSFTLSFVNVRGAPVGSGKRKTYLPGHQASTRLKGLKRCALRCVRQNQEDRTIRRQWTDSVRKKRLPQQPCGPEQLHEIIAAPSLQDYTIVVVDAYGRGNTLLGLLHEDGHHDALSSSPSFFGKSYFCSRCFQAYNDQGQHACPNNEANHCGACLQEVCQDHADAYRHYRSPHVLCYPCGRFFYRDACLQAHRSKTQAGKPVDLKHPSVCATRCKCKECHRVLCSIKEIRTHRCGFWECRCCHEQVDVHQHRCFLQVQKTPTEVQREQRRRQSDRQVAAGGLQSLLDNGAAGLHALLAGNDNHEKEEDDDNPPRGDTSPTCFFLH